MPVLRLARVTNSVAAADERVRASAHVKSLEISPVWQPYRAGVGSRTWGAGAKMTTLSPDERLELLVSGLDRMDTLGYKRSSTQKLFHKAFIVAMLKQIYGRDIQRHVGRLMKRFDVTEIRPDVIVCAIRRGGKTFSVALFAAVYVSTQPGVILNIYSTCKRTAHKLQALIWKMVVTLAGSPSVIKAYNQEELVVHCHGTTSTVNSLPASGTQYAQVGAMGGEGGAAGFAKRAQTSRSVLICLLVSTFVVSAVSVGFDIANWAMLNNHAPLPAPLVAGVGSYDAGLANAGVYLMQGVQSSACHGVATCPAGDIDCAMCKCSEQASASTAGPCGIVTCSGAALLDVSGNCATASTLGKCTVVQLASAGCTA